MEVIESRDVELVWKKALDCIYKDGKRTSTKRELPGIILVFQGIEPVNRQLINLVSKGDFRKYWDRAEKLFTTREDLQWKRSYLGQVRGDRNGIDQFELTARQASHSPGSKNLIWSFFAPDHLKRGAVIAASVPCPLVVDIKIRQRCLNATVLFRSQDTLRMTIADYYFIRSMLLKFRRRVKQLAAERGRQRDFHLGQMCFHVCSAFIRAKDVALVNSLSPG